ncbi:MAG: response regulator [Chitinivibrionales bacterium]|nr:response regulator [Chitinivibrionales bacterium]
MEKLLLVEDNEGLREQMKWALKSNFEILEAVNHQECLDTFKKCHPLLMCLDMGLDNVPDKGLEIIDQILEFDRTVKIIVITANTNEALGPVAINKGAFDYLRKPLEIDELNVILKRAARLHDMEIPEQVTQQETSFHSDENFSMIGSSEPMQDIFFTIKRLAQTEVNVLITGDSGTGKELCARAIHYHSPRKDAPFVPINCGAIPENLLESELFGYKKGAFTGADMDKPGLIKAADRGTLFLDEIAEMPRLLQVKLLRFLEDHSYQRLGDVIMLEADVRIIAATNRGDLASEKNEAMRTDLYYRLSEFEIHLPPLKERGEDIVLLANRLIERNRHKFDMPRLKLSTRAEKMLKLYSWPGNVRELENKLSRATITCRNQIIEPDDLQLNLATFDNVTLKEAREMFEKEFVINALKHCNYTISDAAKKIGVSRPTLYDLIKKLEIEVKE